MDEELADIEDWLCMESEEWRLWLDIEEEGFCLTWLATTRLFKAATTGTKVKAWSRRGLRGAWVKFCQRESLCQHFTSSYYPTVTDLFWVRYWDFIFFFFFKVEDERVLWNHSAWDAHGWSRYKTQCLFINWKDWRTDLGQPGTGGVQGRGYLGVVLTRVFTG